MAYRVIFETNRVGTFMSVNHGTADVPEWFIHELPTECRFAVDMDADGRFEMTILKDNSDQPQEKSIGE